MIRYTGKFIFALFYSHHPEWQWRGFEWRDVFKQKPEDSHWLNTFSSHNEYLCIFIEATYDMQRCLQFTSSMWRQHCEYFIDFWFCIWSLLWILCPFFCLFLGFFYRTEDAFVHHLTNRDLKNIFVAIVWDLYYIYFPNPDENAFLTMALEALYKLEIFISYHLAVFCHFYMFVMNKLFYSECIRLKECWLIFFSKPLTPITVNTIVPLIKAWVTL